MCWNCFIIITTHVFSLLDSMSTYLYKQLICKVSFGNDLLIPLFEDINFYINEINITTVSIEL